MRIGYACINTSVKRKLRNCRLATFYVNGTSLIKELTIQNLETVYEYLRWNIQHKIYFYRFSSDIIPFASRPDMDWNWSEDPDVLAWTTKIQNLAARYNIRLSIHPGQYTVLNSNKEDVVENAKLELRYQAKLMDLVGGTDMILHVGGAYNNKEESKRRFIENFKTLDFNIQSKLRIENDDVIFNLIDCFDISKEIRTPICFDIHHHNCNPSDIAPEELFNAVKSTWGDLVPKVHLSSGKTGKMDRHHADLITQEDLTALMTVLNGSDVDIMVEAKAKEKAAFDVIKKLRKIEIAS